MGLFTSSGTTVTGQIKAATIGHLLAHETLWKPQLVKMNALDGDWTWKADFERDELPVLSRETYVLTLDDREYPLGLMSIEFQPGTVYIERLAVAPENRKTLVTAPAFRGVGAGLFLHAVMRSVSTDRGGRLWLHSLEDPDTIAFYGRRMKMVETGIDPVDGQRMRRFELSIESATSLLGGPP